DQRLHRGGLVRLRAGRDAVHRRSRRRRLRPADRLAVRACDAAADSRPGPVPVGGQARDAGAARAPGVDAAPPALKAARSSAGSTAPSQRATTMVATALPTKLVRLRHSLMKRSTPRISAMPATGIAGTTESVAASTMK